MAENPRLPEKVMKEVFFNGSRDVSDLPEDSIPHFGHSRHLEFHSLTEDGTHSLRRILCCLAASNPDVDYCPFITDIIAVALNYMEEVEAFYLGQRLLTRSRTDEWYFPLTLLHFHIFSETFKRLFEEKLEILFKHTKSIGALEGVLGICKDWFFRELIDHLPRYPFLRVMDTFLFEGSKIFYRVGLAILKLHSSSLLVLDNTNAYLEVLGKMSKSSHDATKLLQIAFEFSLSRKDFVRIQACVKPTIDTIRLPKTERPILIWPKFEPKDSIVMNTKQCMKIWAWLPKQCHLGDPKRIFCTGEDGYNLTSMLAEIAGRGPLLILVLDDKDNMFGAFLSDSLVVSRTPVVDRQSFVFSFQKSFPAEVSRWQVDERDNDILYTANSKFFALSGG